MCQLAEKYGFMGIGMSMEPIEELGADEVEQYLDVYSLVPAMTGIPVNFRDDDETFENDLARLPFFAQAMSEVGCTRVTTWIMPWHETLSYEERFERLRERTARICDVLETYGLRYGLEFVGPETMRRHKPNPFIHDIDGMLELIEAVDYPNLGFLLDAFHWYASGGTAEDLQKLSDDLIVAVHVNDAAAGVAREQQIDNQREMPGATGVIDIETFMNALVSMNYSGPVVVEPFNQEVREMPSEKAVQFTAESLDAIWPAGVEQAGA
jgi:sugar phosphate isomerase/epimerase